MWFFGRGVRWGGVGMPGVRVAERRVMDEGCGLAGRAWASTMDRGVGGRKEEDGAGWLARRIGICIWDLIGILIRSGWAVRTSWVGSGLQFKPAFPKGAQKLLNRCLTV